MKMNPIEKSSLNLSIEKGSLQEKVKKKIELCYGFAESFFQNKLKSGFFGQELADKRLILPGLVIDENVEGLAYFRQSSWAFGYNPKAISRESRRFKRESDFLNLAIPSIVFHEYFHYIQTVLKIDTEANKTLTEDSADFFSGALLKIFIEENNIDDTEVQSVFEWLGDFTGAEVYLDDLNETETKYGKVITSYDGGEVRTTGGHGMSYHRKRLLSVGYRTGNLQKLTKLDPDTYNDSYFLM